VSCACRASVNLSEITAMASTPSELHILPVVKGYYGGPWSTARATGLQAKLRIGEMGPSADTLCSLLPILRTPRSEAGRDFGIEASPCSRLLYLDVR
jgi:hypothetical protein